MTKHNDESMVALHLSTRDVGDYVKAFESGPQEGGNIHKYIRQSITISSTKPTGYAPSFVHCPLSASQTFHLFRLRAADRPFCNTFKMFAINPKANWRSLWASCVALQPKEYNKKDDEKRLMVGPVAFNPYLLVHLSKCLAITHCVNTFFFHETIIF